MNDHPPVISLPRTMWSHPGEAPEWRRTYDTWAVNEIKRVIAQGRKEPLQPDVLGLIPYRPELLLRIGPPALTLPDLHDVIIAHPACALALLMGFYDATAEQLEKFLYGSGEAVFQLMCWSAETGRTLRQSEGFYRQTLITDCYWGFLHAKQTRNESLLAELLIWCADERQRYAAAAAYFLLRHPAEPIGPYRELLAANPFYAYLALPRLSLRGFSVRAEEIGSAPKWACHFALSAFTGQRDDFIPLAETDPAWLLELAAGLGWLTQPKKLPGLSQIIANRAAGHALQRPAMRFLVDVKQTGRPS